MIHFCPMCANMLLIENGNDNKLRYSCQVRGISFPPLTREICSYICPISQQVNFVFSTQDEERAEEFFEEGGNWDECPSANGPPLLQASESHATVTCQKCGKVGAKFRELQIRSADEGSTLFYRCVNKDCHFMWVEQ